MRVRHVVLGSMMALLAASLLRAQTPVLGDIEAPYPALQNSVKIAGGSYGPGAVAYGPAGTPLILSGKNFGPIGTVQFIGYKNGAVDPGTTVQATVTSWSPSLLFLTVPSGAVSGLVTVTAEGKTGNGLPFVVMNGVYAGSCPASPPNSQLQITTSGLSSGTVGQAYSAALNATGGAPPYTWSLTGNALPAGLSLSSSGTIAGTPTTVGGPVNLTVQAVDSKAQATDAVLSLTINSQVLTAATVYSYTVPSGGYDGVGNVTVSTDSVMGTWNFGYDAMNRLSTATAGANVPGAYAGDYGCWSYDAFGNRTSGAMSTTPCASNPPLMSWASQSTANNNQMAATNQAPAGVQYDASGDLTYDGVNQYLYDGDGRLCAVSSTPVPGMTTMTGYIYNAEGARVAKGTISSMSCDVTANGFQLTESYVLGQGGEQLSMMGGSGNWQRTNVYGGGALLATYDASGLHFHMADPLGTRRLQTNAAGVPELDCQSLPFGDAQYCFTDPNAPASADDASPLHYAGLETDPESGLDSAMYRQYQPALGRWQSPDPYSGSYDWSDPQSLNRYAYVSNRPIFATDPSGLDDVPIGNPACSMNLLVCLFGSLFPDFGGVSGGTFHGSLGTRPSGGPWDDKFGVPYGGLTNGIQQALGLPTMADVGCNPICDATNYGTGETLAQLKQAYCEATAGSISGLENIFSNSVGKYDFGWNEHKDDTWSLWGKTLNANMMGNFIAGFEGYAYDYKYFLGAPFAQTAVEGGGIAFHLAGATKAKNDPFDRTGMPDIRDGERFARLFVDYPPNCNSSEPF